MLTCAGRCEFTLNSDLFGHAWIGGFVFLLSNVSSSTAQFPFLFRPTFIALVAQAKPSFSDIKKKNVGEVVREISAAALEKVKLVGPRKRRRPVVAVVSSALYRYLILQIGLNHFCLESKNPAAIGSK